MNMNKYILSVALVTLIGIGCNKVLDTKVDTQLTDEDIENNYNNLRDFGYSAYTNVQNGFYSIDNNLFAAATDDAEQTMPTSQAQFFNNGSWSAFYNPDDQCSNDYEGIFYCNYFLENSSDYRNILARNRDTVSDGGNLYRRDVSDIQWLRAENRVLRAYYYFDLIKRYGGVPLITRTYSRNENTHIPRSSYDEIVDFIIKDIDVAMDSLQTDWTSFSTDLTGRITKGVALALKSRVLLYAASPLHNDGNNGEKWLRAADAAHQVIELGTYQLDGNYRNLFIADNTMKSPETIWCIRMAPGNDVEIKNYPVGTPGGNSGVTPSQNLVDAYEYTGTADPANPYANRDPRLAYTIVTNNSQWNGRTMQIYSGGQDDPAMAAASRTGYYLKKFLNDNLDLVNNDIEARAWILFRYAEILLNYAEAMNEAFGPNNTASYGLSAVNALNMVRQRTGVNMPAITATSKEQMRTLIKRERRVELAFEGHRWWDLVRWQDAASMLNQPLRGVRITNMGGGIFNYQYFNVENRVFTAPKMYLYPIPQNEVTKSNGVLIQNPGW